MVLEKRLSQLSYVLLGIIGLKTGLKPELPVKIISLFVFYYWLYRALKVCQLPAKNKRLILASCFLLCIPAYMHAFSGLETLLFAYLVFEYLFYVEGSVHLNLYLSLSFNFV